MKLSILSSVVLIGVSACGGETTGSGARIAPASNAAEIARKGGAEPAPPNGTEKQLAGGAQPAPPSAAGQK